MTTPDLKGAMTPTAPRPKKRWIWYLLLVLLVLGGLLWWWLAGRVDQDDAANGAVNTVNTPVNSVTEVNAADVPVTLVQFESTDGNTLATYKLMGDGRWQTAGTWQRVAGETSGLVMLRTNIPGLYSVWRTTLGAAVLVDSSGQTVTDARYQIYANHSGYESVIYPLPSGDFLMPGNGTEVTDWPTANMTNQAIYRLNSQGVLTDTIPVPGLITNSLDGLRVRAVTADGERAYLTVAGYEGNQTDNLWQLDLGSKQVTTVAGATGFTYGDVVVSGPLEAALTVRATEGPCVGGCLGDTMPTVPATVVWHNLATGTYTTVHASNTYLPSLIMSADSRQAFIYETESQNSGATTIGHGIWRVDLTTGQETKLASNLLVQGVSSDGGFLLVAPTLVTSQTQLTSMSVLNVATGALTPVSNLESAATLRLGYFTPISSLAN